MGILYIVIIATFIIIKITFNSLHGSLYVGCAKFNNDNFYKSFSKFTELGALKQETERVPLTWCHNRLDVFS